MTNKRTSNKRTSTGKDKQRQEQATARKSNGKNKDNGESKDNGKNKDNGENRSNLQQASGSGDGHAFNAHGGRGAGASEDEVVADGCDVAVHVLEVAGYGDLFDGVGEFAVLDPDPAGPLRVVAPDDL